VGVVSPVEVVHWNPRRNRIPMLRRYPVGPRVKNFGDLIGPMVVAALVRREGLAGRATGRLLAVGSILHLAADGDSVWGSGVNAKIPVSQHRFSRLDVRAVRGPLTRRWLAEHKGIEAPEVYGDPALLLRAVRPDLFAGERHVTRRLTVVPNLNDYPRMIGVRDVIDPRRPVADVIARIRSSEAVISSSLHGIVIAELAGVPVVPLAPSATDAPLGAEPPFKYEDYYLGTGRELPELRIDLTAARSAARSQQASRVDLGGIAQGLLGAFPYDLWEAAA
jgi:pyruvyltransferase